MGFIRRYWELIKLLFRYIRFKIRQSRLKTSEKFVVTTTDGPIKGVKRISIWNDPFYSFEKIPFAKPPIGDLRFKAPVPPNPWTEILDCTREGPVPLQTNLISKRIEGSEDCLYLNVFTKNLKPDQPMPVMIWIYGGGFENGGATKDLYSPDYFMQKDIVLVTIAYRVGPFGFLCFNDPDLNIPGNAGLKDQVLALKWVKKNCMNFGGNPDNITIFGESAGGASTHYMMLTEQTRGLFHKAILMSGSALCPWALHNSSNQLGYRLAKALGYHESTDEKKCFEFILKAKIDDILKAERKILTENDKNKRVLFPFGPVIEPYVTEDCVVPEDPILMMRTAWSNDIPIIIGGTSHEGLLFYPESEFPIEYWLDKKIAKGLINNLKNCENLIPLDLNLETHDDKCIEYGIQLKKEYFGDEEPNITKHKNAYIELMGHKMFWHALHRTILSRQQYAKGSPTYVYRFAVDSEILNLFRLFICGKELKGTSHGDDIFYLFYGSGSPYIKNRSKEHTFIIKLIDLFTRFAKTGNPNDENELIDWKSINEQENDDKQQKYKCFNLELDEMKLIDFPDLEKLQIWDRFYKRLI